MKKKICFILFTFYVSLAFPQTLQVSIGSTSNYEKFIETKYDPTDGGIISVGYINNPSSGTGNDCFITKMNSLHEIVWQKIISNPGDDNFNQVIVCSNGDYLAVGKLTQNGKIRGYVCRINSSTGDMIWASTSVLTNSAHGDLFYDVIETANNNIAIAGTYDFLPGSTNGMIIVLKSNGTVLWSYITDFDKASDEFLCINQLPNDNLIIGGFYNNGTSYNADILEFNEISGSVVSENVYSINTTVPGDPTALNSISPGKCIVKNGIVYFYLAIFNGYGGGSSTYMNVAVYNQTTKDLSGTIYYHPGNSTAEGYGFYPIGDNDLLISQSFASPNNVFISRVKNGTIIYDRKVSSPVYSILSVNASNTKVTYCGYANIASDRDAYNLFSSTNLPISTSTCNIINSNALSLKVLNLTANAINVLTISPVTAMSSNSLTPVSTNYLVNNICGCLTATINTQPVNASLCGSGDTSFTIIASNASTYQWQVNMGLGSGWINLVNNTPYSGATSNTLVITAASTTITNYQYRCLVANSCSNDTSSVAILKVQALSIPSVNISVLPNSTICPGTSVTFTATPINSGASPYYQWKLNGSNVGTNSTTYTNAALVNTDIVTCLFTSNLSCVSNASVTSNAITMVVSGNLTPAISITSTPSNAICAGTRVTFTATTTNGGVSPFYQWKLNGSNVGANSRTYTNATLANTDIVTCDMTSGLSCANPATVTSNIITMTVNATVTPTIFITASPGNIICAGTSVTFTAATTNGGASPNYHWKLNGSNVGTNSNTYTNPALINTDAVTCILTLNASCASPANVPANTISMIVNANLRPSVSITAKPGNTICAGTSATFVATPTNGGASPTYQWKLNGDNVGTNSNTYANAALKNSDIITCDLTSDVACASSVRVSSNVITMLVNSLVTPTVSITALPGNTICSGTSVKFTATTTNGGISPNYQWELNGIKVGANSNTYTNKVLINSDIITCGLTSNAACASTANVSSNAITLNVITIPSPNLIITASTNSICPNTPVTFTAIPANVGTTPSFQWKLNGNDVGEDFPTYSSPKLNNGDRIYCVMNSSTTCSVSPYTSLNTIIMRVNPVPSITITPLNPTILSGNAIQLTAAATGNVSTYLWTPATGLSDATIPTPLANPRSTTVYNLKATSSEGCSSTSTITIKVSNEIYIPNSFTPNGDGKNDVFRIPPQTALNLKRFLIFNRYGNEIFNTNDINKGWDGTYKGTKSAIGAYVYIIQGSDFRGEVYLKGTVILIY